MPSAFTTGKNSRLKNKNNSIVKDMGELIKPVPTLSTQGPVLHKSGGWHSHSEWSPLEVCNGALSLKLISLSWKEIPVHLKMSEVTRSVCFFPWWWRQQDEHILKSRTEKSWFGIKMYPRHSIIVHRSLGKISSVAHYIHRKEDKIRPPKSPFLMINLYLSHGQPRAKMSKRGSDPCPQGL